MKYLANAVKAKLIDNMSTEKYHIPSIVLMERAAYETAAVINDNEILSRKVLVVAGTGNNGGDALAAGRILFEYGYDVSMYVAGNKNKMTPECRTQYDIAVKSGVRETADNDLESGDADYSDWFAGYDIIIDGLFGVGLSRNIDGMYRDIINALNECGRRIYSIDVPSGIDASNGNIRGCAVKAYHTVTYGLSKPGLMLYAGREHAGKVSVRDAGFPKMAVNDAGLCEYTYEREDLCKLPERVCNSNKGTYGKVLVIAGSRGISGAAYMSAKSAYKSGCGIVKVITCNENVQVIQTMLPEAIIRGYNPDSSESMENALKSECGWADAIVIGPGIGTGMQSRELVRLTLSESRCNIVMDADAINIMADGSDEGLIKLFRYNLGRIVITPHMKEMSRITGDSIEDMKKDIPGYVIDYCSRNKGIVLVLKDACTIVSDGNTLYYNSSGNNGMATGGSGDVLTGIIASYMAQKSDRYEAARLGVYVHGLAGDEAAGRYNRYYVTATDIIEGLAYIRWEMPPTSIGGE